MGSTNADADAAVQQLETDSESDGESSGQAGSIVLPEHTEFFRNLANAKQFAIDIGGSLTKVAYFSTVSHRRIRYATASDVKIKDEDEFAYEIWEGARLHFIKFETKFIEECLDFIQKHLVATSDKMKGKFVKATGGGSYKYCKLIEEKLGLKPEKEDEVACLIKGANFLLKNVSHEAFTFERKRNPEYEFLPSGPVLFPYLLVNVGSGVSILKVESEEKFERIGGTATGGGTFWGLGTLLTGAKGFDELLKLAEEGDHRNVDMLVKDIYSGAYQNLGLPGDLIASSFGKAAHLNKEDISPADVARSLLFTIANDIGQIACLYAMQHGLSRIYFGGYFLRNHPLSMHAVSYSIRYWSKNTVEALFLRHEGYLGAIGAFLKGTEELQPEKYSWQENFAGSSGFGSENAVFRSKDLVGKDSKTELNGLPWKFPSRISVEQLEIDQQQRPIGFFSLLSSKVEYIPDVVDLTKDVEAREYWLTCMEGWVEKIVGRAIESQSTLDSAPNRALRCRQKLLGRLRYLQHHPCAYGSLTVRSLLDTVEQCLREFEFPDPYLVQKQTENSCALTELSARIEYLDGLDPEDRNVDLIWGVLAGNFFDWGAKAVTGIFEGPDPFGFMEAKNMLQKRPWLMDSLDDWIERLKKPPHKCATIFVDNSGYDFVLGILPFVREFLKRGTEVILCANSDPAVNDMTYSEMVPLMNIVSEMCPVFRKSLENKLLVLQSTGQGSPCLDFSRVSQDLINIAEEKQSDLVVIEGMGRTIHTNLYAKFRCDALKLAVIKNQWVAARLGGDVFSVVCAYETPDV